MFFFFKQKTAYEMRISDWSSDVCSSDLRRHEYRWSGDRPWLVIPARPRMTPTHAPIESINDFVVKFANVNGSGSASANELFAKAILRRSEEHTSELQSLMRISYAVFCLKKKKTYTITVTHMTIPHQYD